MDYEKKVREALDSEETDYEVVRWIECTFPELAESEDEMIRKSIIECVKEQIRQGNYLNINVDKAIAYLEKQKDSKWSPSEDEMGVLYKLCYLSNQITDEDDTKLTRLYQDLKREYFNGHSFENMFPSGKQKEQKPNDDPLNDPKFINGFDTGREVQRIFDEKKPAEWSEEDSIKIGTLSSIIFDYAFYKDALDENNDLTGEYAELENWLKYLPERFNLQPHWKPSEEQMKALKYAAYHMLPGEEYRDVLFSLFKDLKELM